MYIPTTRFGTIAVDPADVLHFAQGLIGMESCRQWVLLADSENPALAWLQSVDLPEIALAVVSPRRFVANYQVRVSGRDLAPLAMGSTRDAQVLVVLNRAEDGLTLNLKAPLVINVDARKGRQVIAKNDHDVQYLLGATVPMRRSA